MIAVLRCARADDRLRPMTSIVMFDDRSAALDVVADVRAIFDVRTGCFTTRQRLEHHLGRTTDAVFVHADLTPLVRETSTTLVNEWPTGAAALLVSGRCVLPPDELKNLAQNTAIREKHSGEIIAAHVDRATAKAFLSSNKLPASIIVTDSPNPCLLHRPWDIIRFRDAAIRADLASMTSPVSTLPAGVTAIGDHPIRVHGGATIAPSVVLDSTNGAIVIDDSATVRPGAIIVGPAYIGPHSAVLEHALIKANTAIGPVCKVAGEVGGTIFQSHSNKGHDGHVGDSWVGQWVNLGAGTTNSNLLNTYGEITAATSPSARRERTGLTFFGTVFGDHVKTAICTRLMTGSIIGTGAMIASTAAPPTAVRRFAWLTDKGETRFRLDRFFDAAERMMERRNATITPALRDRLTSLFAQDES